MVEGKVLLVDDERDFADLLAQRLESRGVHVRTAYDGQQAMQEIRKQEPEVVVLDVNMPGMSGLETLQAIKSLRPHAEVLLLTADTTLETAVSGMKLGARDYLVKPASMEDLMTSIEGALRHRNERLGSLRMAMTARLAALGELAKGVAHEINNPLTIMINEAGWIADLLEEPEFQASPHRQEMMHAVEGIQKQAKRCKAITSKLLALRRPSDARSEVMDLSSLIAALVHERDRRLDQQGVRVSIDVSPQAGAEPVRRADFEELLGNLVDNALDAMEKGGLLTVSASVQEEHFSISVADTGCGIDPGILSRIFEPFFSTKEVGKGTGLGLAICHGIVSAMDGDISVQSELERGSVFTVRLPLTVRARSG